MKLNNKLLIALLFFLTAIFLYTQFTGNKKGNFKKDLFVTDTSKITSVTIYSDENSGKPLTLNRKDNGWEMTNDSIGSTAANPATVSSMLAIFNQLSVKRVAAAGKDKWKEYQVNENAHRVVAKQGNKTVLDFYIGKFNIGQPQGGGISEGNFNPNQNQQRPVLTTYVRPHNDDKVYAIPGMISASFSNDPKTYQPKSLEDSQILTPDTIIRQQNISTE